MQRNDRIVKFNVTYFKAEDKEPHETVFCYVGMSDGMAKSYAMDAAEAYCLTTDYKTFEIEQMQIN